MKLKSLILGTFLSFCCLPTAKAQTLPDFTVLAEELIPTVVNITIELDTDSQEFEDIELTTPKISSGSGFLISQDGTIVTNKHVIDNAKKIYITTHNNQTYEAEIIGIDEKTDIALLQAYVKTEWKYVKFGDSDNIKVGEWILAIGNPFGLGNTVTKGIISAKSRDIESGNYDNFIQTDASINRGNSGGPMFNMQGELIGINNAIFSTTGTSMGIGFAIPINQVKWVIKELKEKGQVERGWVGIGIQSTTYKTPKMLKTGPDTEKEALFLEQGAIVSVLTYNAPAQKAGLKVGDIITNYNNIRIDNTKNLSRIIAETPIGSTAKFGIIRNGKEMSLDIIIEKMPDEKKEKTRDVMDKVIESNATIIEDLDIYITESKHGLVISFVAPNSDAAQKGLIVGDIITKIDKNNVFSAEDIKNYVNDAKLDNNRPVLLQIQSDDINHFVTIELKK